VRSDARAEAEPQGRGHLPLGARADDALVGPVRAGNAFEETVERLLTAIKLGIVAPGARLPPERELSDRLSVSRVTLREAIRALQQSGYVESRRGRYGGTFVNGILPKLNKAAARRLVKQTGGDIDDVLLLRDVVEVGAAEQAACRVLGDLERTHLIACQQDCARAGDLAEYRRRDSRLHLAIAEVTGSPSLTSAVAGARMRVNALLDAIPVLERNVQHSEVQHADIVVAILAGDAARARRAMAEHLSATAALLRGFLG
jgi:DNA-binding FadR family transcriptional regulator